MKDMSAFEAFRESPAPETLMSLLRAHQDGVYTVCLQVLRHPQDAEDAAQEALMKIASGAAALREPRAFKCWLYRVVFRAAVDHLRQRESRRRLAEGRTAMTGPTLPDAELAALHEALAGLPDEDRLLLVEHYFEKTPLEELGRREGISGVAVWKRVERAKERLKRGLAGMGVALGGSEVSQALESVTPAAAPSGLVGAVIASKAALIAAGGAAVGTKSTFAVGLVAALILILLVGAGMLFYSGGMLPSQDPLAKESASSGPAKPKSPSNVGAPGVHSNLISMGPGDPQACRKILARALRSLQSNDMHQLAWLLGFGHSGGMTAVDQFIRDFTASAGTDLIPISTSMLADAVSDSSRMLIALALGRSGNPATLALLKDLAGESSGVQLIVTALHSIGLIRSPEGFRFLQSTWERAKDTKPLAPAILSAIGRHGSDGLAWLLAEVKNSKSDTVLAHEGRPWSFSFTKADLLSFARGSGVFEDLVKILEAEADPEIREGAAMAMAYNLGPGQVESLTGLFARERNPNLKTYVIHALLSARDETALWESTQRIRSDFADRVLTETPFPTGNPGLDRALIRLGAMASPDKTDSMYERFIALCPDKKDNESIWSLGEIVAACVRRPDAKTRIPALLESMGLSEEERGFVFMRGLSDALPEVAALLAKPVLEIVRHAHPRDTRFENGLRALARGGTDDPTLSAALQEVHDRLTDPADRRLLLMKVLQNFPGRGSQSCEVTSPQEFLAAMATQAAEPETLLRAAYGLLTSGTGRDLDPALRLRVGEWIGRDMKCASMIPQESLSVAPSVIGEYYARYGTPGDSAWLRDLPDTFPYPSEWSPRERTNVRDSLILESRRALDAIRLRN